MKKLILAIAITGIVAGCTPVNNSEEQMSHDHDTEQGASTKYTCPMHPQVTSEKPGKCPVCGMDLVAQVSANGAIGDLMLADSQIKLANITTKKASLENVGSAIVVNGRLVRNEDMISVISSRVPGRIEKLYVKETGRKVTKGEPVYDLYSESLLTLQQEYLLAVDQNDSTRETVAPALKSFADAARKKLLLYGMTPSQIDRLGRAQKVLNPITFVAPASGIVDNIAVEEGEFVAEGSVIMRVQDQSVLWLEAELYPDELSLARVGDKINVSVAGYGNLQSEATVAFLSPEFRANSQILTMRALLPNHSGVLQPGMEVRVSFASRDKRTLALPVDAVIRDAQGAHVYVQRGRNTFRPQQVGTGMENAALIEVTNGLTEGDTVVISGAYLLYSEFILKKGTDPMATHIH